MGELVDDLTSVRSYLRAERAASTHRAYGNDFADFERWCAAAGCCSLPAEPIVVARYLASLADRGLKAATICRRLIGIRHYHKINGHPPPSGAEGVRAVLRGIMRTIGTAQTRKSPVTVPILTKMLAQLPDTLVGKRDRALLLIGFAAALRRSELVALNIDDIEFSSEGAIVIIRRSKIDQAAAGYAIAVPRGTKLRPVEAVEDWLAAASISSGPIFRAIQKGGKRLNAARLTSHSVSLIIKKYAAAVGADASAFSGHSLRTGFVTSALESGEDVLRIMDVTRHRDPKTLKVYDRRTRAFRDHAGRKFL